MARSFLIGIVTLVLFCPVANSQQEVRKAGNIEPEIERRIDSVFEEFGKANSPGCVVGIYRNGKLSFAKGYGYADLEHHVPLTPDTVFDIASNGKQFTGMLIELLRRRNKISLDDDVRKYLKQVPDFGQVITLRHLLSNTSGLREFTDLLELKGRGLEFRINRKGFLKLIENQTELNFTPGEQYLYCGTNWILLALVVEQVEGKPFPEVMENEIFAPLGMESSLVRDDPFQLVPNRARTYTPMEDGGYHINHAWGLTTNLAGGSVVFTTIKDLAKWDANFYSESVGGKGMAAAMYQRGQLNNGEQIHYAKGLTIGKYRGMEVVYHGGMGGGSSQLIRFPKIKTSIAVLSNQYHTHTDTHQFALDVAKIVIGDHFEDKIEFPRIPIGQQQKILDIIYEFEGTYWIEKQMRRTHFVVRDGILCEESDGESYPMNYLGKGKFQDEYETIIFGSDGKSANGMTLSTGEKYKLIRWDKWQPSADQLSKYVGNYFSPELNFAWNIQVESGKLLLKRDGLDDVILKPGTQDVFVAPNRKLEFKKEDSKFVLLLVSTDRIARLRFTRTNR